MHHRKPPTANRKPGPKPKALVLYGYGLNCDYETPFALNKAGAEADRVHTTDLLENPRLLWDYHLLAVPGGFSWGDEHGAGVILALRLKLALGSALQEFIDAGRLVIGICNGFQVLVNLGLLPGLAGRAGERLAALIPNDCGNFRDAWVHLKVRTVPLRLHPGAWTIWNCRYATAKANSSPPRKCSRKSRIRARSP